MASVTAFALLALTAAPAIPLPAPPPPASPAHRLSSHLVAGLLVDPAVMPPASVYSVQVALDGGPERLGPYLADHVEAAVARTVPGTTRSQARAMSPTHRIALDVRVRRARVDATARLVRLPRSIWERIRAPKGEVLSSASASAEMDLELRILSDAPPTRVRLETLRLVGISKQSDERLLSGPILDMAWADLDGDGLREIICLQPERLVTARWNQGGLAVVDEVFLDATPPAQARLRQPMGRLVVVTAEDGTVALVVASSDRATASLWRYGRDRWRLVDAAPAAGHWPLYATGPDRWLVRGSMTPFGELQQAHIGQTEPGDDGFTQRPIQDVIAPFHGLRAFGIFAASTPSWSPHLVMASPDAGLTVWPASAPEAALNFEGVGDAAVVCDLDQNGTPELLHTSAVLEGADRLTLLELRGTRGVRRRWSRPTSRPVSSMVTTDLDEDGWREVLVASWEAGKGDLALVAPRVSP